MKFVLIFIITNLYLLSAHSQPSMNEAATGFSQQGQLFSVKLVPGDTSLKVYVVGHKTVDIKESLYGIEASLYLGSEVKTLVMTPENDYYVIKRPKGQGQLNLKLRSISNVYDEFQFHLK